MAGWNPKRVCEALCDHCLAPDTSGDGKGCDNMSAMVVQLKAYQQADAGRLNEATGLPSQGIHACSVLCIGMLSPGAMQSSLSPSGAWLLCLMKLPSLYPVMHLVAALDDLISMVTLTTVSAALTTHDCKVRQLLPCHCSASHLCMVLLQGSRSRTRAPQKTLARR